MHKPYITRKNLVVLSIAFLYSVLLCFTGFCLTYEKANLVKKIGQALKFKEISGGLSLTVFLVLVAVYIMVFVASILFERRFAIVNGKKPYTAKMFLIYVGSFLACCALSLGVGALIQLIAGVPVGDAFTFTGQALELTTILFLAVVIVVGGILMFVVNFILVDKPFKFFKEEDAPILEDEEPEETSSVLSSFDEPAGGVGQPMANGMGVTTSDNLVRKADELDDREKVFPALSKMDVDYDGYSIDEYETDDISLDELCTKFRNYLAKQEHLYFDMDTIRFFISGFAASHFMILEGLSGTGKSSLPRYFAKFVSANLLFVPVQATWRDKTNLIGYFNDFSKTYTETEFLVNMYHGNYNPDMIHMYVLDEMNISRVEYYFADFLSVLEYPKEEWNLKIMQLPYNFVPPAKLMEGVLHVPENSYFVGTANKDDSTFTITDKVYDRAITIDFEEKNDEFSVKEEVAPIHLSQSKLNSLYASAKEKASNQMTKADFDKLFVITNYINEQFDITFGNRIQNQIAELVPVFVECGGSKEEALDFLLSRKVIAKVEGRFEEYVKGALKELLALIEKTYGKGVLKRSEKTIQSIMRRL